MENLSIDFSRVYGINRLKPQPHDKKKESAPRRIEGSIVGVRSGRNTDSPHSKIITLLVENQPDLNKLMGKKVRLVIME